MAKRETRNRRLALLLTPSQFEELRTEAFNNRKSIGRIVRERVFGIDEGPSEDDE